jgi:beta-glucosidase
MHPGGERMFIEGPRDALYPFGFGLSYSSFAYSDLVISKSGAYDVTVRCTVTNTGHMDADDVVQLYIDDVESSIVTPLLLLKGFQRVSLKSGEGKEVTFHLNWDSFKLMNARYEWVVEPGDFRICIGAASNDIRLEGIVTI